MTRRATVVCLASSLVGLVMAIDLAGRGGEGGEVVPPWDGDLPRDVSRQVPWEISGQIVRIEYGGQRVIVEQGTGGEVEVFIPSGTPINIEGDGSVPMELFCAGRQVRLFVEPDIPDLDPDVPDPFTARFVLVEAVKRSGEVVVIYNGDRALNVDGAHVNFQPGATILDSRGTADTLVEIEEIKVTDQLEYFGLEDCAGGTGFTAFVILIVE